MSQAVKRILSSIVTVLFLLAACAPAPAATQDPEAAQLRETVEALSAVQNAQATPDPRIEELLQKIDSLSTQSSQSTPDPAIEELKQQIAEIAAQQQALNDALLNPTATLAASSISTTPAAGSGLQPAASPAGCDPSSIPTPSILRVDPEQGETYGGATVKITGVNLVYLCGSEWVNSTFLFGNKSVQAENAVCEAGNCTLTVKSPQASDESKDTEVSIKAQNNTVTSQEDFKFTYLVPPTVESVSPNRGSIRGGTVVTITGDGFDEENTEFLFGDVKAVIIDCLDRECSVTSPGLSDEGEDVIVWVQAVNNGAYSQLDLSENTNQIFKYQTTPKFACDAYLVSPSTRGPFEPGEGFKIEWVVKNIGTNAWPAGQDVKFASGSSGNMGEVSFIEIGRSLAPNDTATITLDAKAPRNKGLQYMNWIVAGQGCSLYVAIQVE